MPQSLLHTLPLGPLHVGLDFGTTNTVLSLTGDAGPVATVRFAYEGGLLDTYRSVMCFWTDDEESYSDLRVRCGPGAFAAFLEQEGEARLVQSVKTFLSSRSFTSTVIHGQSFTLERLLEVFFRELQKAAAVAGQALSLERITVGRPVKFAGDHADDALAVDRLRTALMRAGFRAVNFAFEPEAAAYYIVRELQAPTTLLVADLGGGTSDFSIARFDPATRHLTPLAFSGVGIAGDKLDFRIIHHVVAPALGKGTRFKPMAQWLEVPNRLYFEFEHWHRLSFLHRPDVMRELREIEQSSDEPLKIAALRLFLERELGFQLYAAVNRCKAQLSCADEAEFHFSSPPIEIHSTIKRSDFEGWIEQDLRSIDVACGQALQQAQLAEADIAMVFLTGGTSLLPAVRQRMAKRFAHARLLTGDEFVSVSNGLALIARDRALLHV